MAQTSRKRLCGSRISSLACGSLCFRYGAAKLPGPTPHQKVGALRAVLKVWRPLADHAPRALPVFPAIAERHAATGSVPARSSRPVCKSGDHDRTRHAKPRRPGREERPRGDFAVAPPCPDDHTRPMPPGRRCGSWSGAGRPSKTSTTGAASPSATHRDPGASGRPRL